MSNADLSGVDLSGIDLSGIDLSGANLSGADLSDAYLSRAYLSGAKLRDDYAAVIGLTQTQLDAACGDANTKLPEGLMPPKPCQAMPRQTAPPPRVP